MTGLTAYAGLLKVAEFKEGDVVFVSGGAAGAVGSMVGQIAKAMGASKVIGSAGSPEKVARLLELGFDAAFNYNDAPVLDQLKEAAGGSAALTSTSITSAASTSKQHLPRSRLAAASQCAVRLPSTTPRSPPVAPRNLAVAIGKQLTLRGFLVGGQRQHAPRVRAEDGRLAGRWSVSYDETIVDGLENAPQAFMDLLDGANTGKMLVRL